MTIQLPLVKYLELLFEGKLRNIVNPEQFKPKGRKNMNENTNDQVVETHVSDQPQPTVEEQAAQAGLDVPEFLRRKAAEDQPAM